MISGPGLSVAFGISTRSKELGGSRAGAGREGDVDEGCTLDISNSSSDFGDSSGGDKESDPTEDGSSAFDDGRALIVDMLTSDEKSR
jgi:hypothetical protein